jgi:hypothetical protein
MSALTKDTSQFVETVIEEETLVMRLDTGDFFALRDTARSIWQAIDGARDKDAVVEAVAAEYGVSPDSIVGEVDAFLAELGTAGLLRRD